MMNTKYDQNNNSKLTQYGSHMVMTNVVPPTKTKYITIDSRFRDEYNFGSVANYNISLPERINDVKSIRVKNIEIPITFYNISENMGNNVFALSILNKKVTIVLPDGQYTEAALVVIINSEITSMTAPFTSIVFKIENHRCMFMNNNSNNDGLLNFEIYKNINGSNNYMTTLGWLMGFRKTEYVIYPNALQMGESFINIFGPRYLYLILDEFKNGNPHSFLSLSRTSELSSQQILARITLDNTTYPFGTILVADDYGNCRSDTRTYSNEINIQRMNVRLVDEFGTIMNLNGMDFSFCIELTHL
jgi:hypothetical protein